MNEAFTPPEQQRSPTEHQAEAPEQERHDCPACPIAREAGANFCPTCGKNLTRGLKQEVPGGEPSRHDASVAPDTAQNDDVEQERPPEEDNDESAVPGDVHQQQSELPAQPADGEPRHAMSPEAHFCLSCTNCTHRAEPKYRLTRRKPDCTYDTGQPLVDELTVGKTSECNLAIPDDDYVSRRHARIFRSDGMLFLEDIGSANGTFLRVRRPIVLQDGDEIVVGTNVLRLEQD